MVRDPVAAQMCTDLWRGQAGRNTSQCLSAVSRNDPMNFPKSTVQRCLWPDLPPCAHYALADRCWGSVC